MLTKTNYSEAEDSLTIYAELQHNREFRAGFLVEHFNKTALKIKNYARIVHPYRAEQVAELGAK